MHSVHACCRRAAWCVLLLGLLLLLLGPLLLQLTKSVLIGESRRRSACVVTVKFTVPTSELYKPGAVTSIPPKPTKYYASSSVAAVCRATVNAIDICEHRRCSTAKQIYPCFTGNTA